MLSIIKRIRKRIRTIWNLPKRVEELEYEMKRNESNYQDGYYQLEATLCKFIINHQLSQGKDLDDGIELIISNGNPQKEDIERLLCQEKRLKKQ